MKCAHCKSPTVCVAPESLLSRLRTLPRVEIGSGLRKFVKEMRDRKPERPQPPKQATGVVGARLGMFTGLVVLALVAAATLIGVNWYQTREAREAQKELGEAIKNVKEGGGGRSFPRPAWITSDTPGSSFCTDNVNRLSCVGISPYMELREEARVEATNAALEEMVNTVGLKIVTPTFQQRVRPLYDDSRARALTEFEQARAKSPSGTEYQKALKTLSTARKGVVAALVATGGSAAPTQHAAWFWEEYTKEPGSGTEFLVFVRFDITVDAINALKATYSDSIDVLGSKIVTVFPGVVWRLPAATNGALVLRSGGALQKLDVAELSVVTAIDGQAVRTASEMARSLSKSGRAAKLTLIDPNGELKNLGD
jgi:hypothetical protein